MKPLLLLLSMLCAFSVTAQTIDTAHLHAIEEVVVSGKAHVKRMGRDVKSMFVAASIPSEVGAECGLVCHAGKRTLQLGMLRLWCYTHNIDTLEFRLRLYPVTKGVVGEPMAHPPIYVHVPPHTRCTSIDLRACDLRVSGDFLRAFQCQQVKVHQVPWEPWNGISFNSNLLSRSYFRTADKPEWDIRKPGIGVSVEGHPVAERSERL